MKKHLVAWCRLLITFALLLVGQSQVLSAQKPSEGLLATPEDLQLARSLHPLVPEEELVWLSGEEKESFLALYRDDKVGKSHGGLLMLADPSTHPDAKLLGKLRRTMPNKGWHTLAISLVGLDRINDDPTLYRAIEKRIRAGVLFLQQKGIKPLIFLGQDRGAGAAACYLAEEQSAPIEGLIALTMVNLVGDKAPFLGAETISQISKPILDVYSDRSPYFVQKQAVARQYAAQKAKNKNYRKWQLDGEKEFLFDGVETLVLNHMNGWLDKKVIHFPSPGKNPPTKESAENEEQLPPATVINQQSSVTKTQDKETRQQAKKETFSQTTVNQESSAKTPNQAPPVSMTSESTANKNSVGMTGMVEMNPNPKQPNPVKPETAANTPPPTTRKPVGENSGKQPNAASKEPPTGMATTAMGGNAPVNSKSPPQENKGNKPQAANKEESTANPTTPKRPKEEEGKPSDATVRKEQPATGMTAPPVGKNPAKEGGETKQPVQGKADPAKDQTTQTPKKREEKVDNIQQPASGTPQPVNSPPP